MNYGVKVISKNVTTAGTPVQAQATTLFSPRVEITAKFSNTGSVYIGSSSSMGATTRRELQPGQSIVLDPPGPRRYFDLTTIWVDSAVNGEGIEITYLGRV